MIARALALWLLLAAATAADVVHMKDGRKIEGKVTDLGTKLQIERQGMKFTVDKSEVDHVEAKEYKEPEKPAATAPTKSRPRYKVRLMSTITSIDANFVMFLPNGWGGNSPVIRGPIPGPGGLKLDLSLSESKLPMEDVAAEAKKSFHGATISGEQAWTIGGRPFVQFEAADAKTTTLVQLAKEGDTVVLFRFAADEKKFDERWHQVNTMLRSIKWLKRVELSREQKDKFMDLYERGYLALQGGRGEEALKLLKDAAVLLPEIGVIQTALGQAYLANKDHQNAVIAIQKALKFEPDNAIDLWELALAYHAWGKEEDTIAALKRVAEVDPENEEAFVTWGLLYANKQKWFDAKDAFKRGAQKNPECVALFVYWGQAAERCEKWSEAKEAYEKALKLDPRNADAAKRLEELKKKK